MTPHLEDLIAFCPPGLCGSGTISVGLLAPSSGFDARRGKGRGGVAKYANPDNKMQTWSGRGRKPNWLVAKVPKGSSL